MVGTYLWHAALCTYAYLESWEALGSSHLGQAICTGVNVNYEKKNFAVAWCRFVGLRLLIDRPTVPMSFGGCPNGTAFIGKWSA